MKVQGFVTRAPRWLRRVLLGLLAAWSLYLLAGNVLINTPLGEALVNRKPEKFQLHWRLGATLWPGRVALWRVEASGQVRRTHWSVRAARADGRIALLPLLRRDLHVPWVQAREVEGEVARTEAEIPPPPTRAGGWTLRFDRIASDSIRRGRFGDWDLQGAGSARVGFVKQLRGGPMELLPSEAAFADARLSEGGREWLREIKLSSSFSIARHRREQAQGIEKLGYTDAELSLEASSATLWVAPDAQDGPALRAVPGQGTLQAQLGYSRGALAPGSRLSWNALLQTIDAGGARRDLPFDLRLDVDRDLHLRARVPPAPGAPGELDAELVVAGNTLPLQDWRERLLGASGRVRGEWQFGSLRWLGRLFTPRPWLDLEGTGRVSADLLIESGHLVAGSRLSVPEVAASAHVLDNRIRGQAHAEGRIEAAQDGALKTRLDIVMESFDIAPTEAPDRAFVAGRDLRLQLEADGELARIRETARARLRFDDARVPDLRAYNRYLPQQMNFVGGSGLLSGDLSLDAAGEVAQGEVSVRGRQAQLAMADVRLRGDIDVAARLRRVSLETRDLDFGGTRLELRDVSFTDAGGDDHRGWWARATVAPGHVATATPYRATGTAEVVMKDVGFLLSLFSRRKDYPRWVFRLIDEGRARASGRVQWRRDSLVLDRVRAENDRFEVLGRMKLQGARREGDLYARWGALSLGVELHDDQRKFHLLRARHWYDQRPHLLP